MENNLGNLVIPIMRRLGDRLNFGYYVGYESQYNKAFGIILKDVIDNGVPSDDRAFALCKSQGVPELSPPPAGCLC